MYILVSIFLSLTSQGTINTSNAMIYPSKAACQEQQTYTRAYLQGKYDGNKEWQYFNTFCIEATVAQAQAN